MTKDVQKEVTTPKIGQTINIRHRTNPKSGKSEISARKDETVRTIKAVYVGGHVKDSAGEMWFIKPSTSGKFDWETAV